MKVTQLHHELPIASHVSIVVSLLPKSCGLLWGSLASQTFGARQFQVVDSVSQSGSRRLTQKADEHAPASPHVRRCTVRSGGACLRGTQQIGRTSRRREKWLPPVTTEGDKVRLSGFLKPPESAWHKMKLTPPRD